jgi:DNA-directed RNA polymerase subunit RPC12/RpoP
MKLDMLDDNDEMTGKRPIYYYPVADKRIKHIQKVWTNNVDKERNEIRKNGGIIVPSPYTDEIGCGMYCGWTTDSIHPHTFKECCCCDETYDITDNYSEIKEGGSYICNSCWDEAKVNRHTRAGAEGKNIFCPHCRSVSKVYHFAWSALGCSHCKNCIDKTDWLIKEVA